MQAGDNHYLKGANFQLNTKPMGDLKSNLDKILPIVKQTLADQLNGNDNLQFYPNPPSVPDAHIIGLSLLARLWGWALRPDADSFIVDSIPILVAHIAREYSTNICRKHFRTAPIRAIAPYWTSISSAISSMWW